MSDLGPQLRYRDDTGLIAHHKNLIASLHWQQPCLALADELRSLTDEIVTEHERFGSAIVVVGDRLPGAPDGDTRSALLDLVRHTKQTGLGTAFIVTAGGFLTGAVVSLLSGMFTLARTREPSQAFREVEPAATWLEQHLRKHDTHWKHGEVRRTLESVVAQGPALSAS